jgi:hypothetical protein
VCVFAAVLFVPQSFFFGPRFITKNRFLPKKFSIHNALASLGKVPVRAVKNAVGLIQFYFSLPFI